MANVGSELPYNRITARFRRERNYVSKKARKEQPTASDEAATNRERVSSRALPAE
jgi:hypothetical protein